jgi:hypothetical protein
LKPFYSYFTKAPFPHPGHLKSSTESNKKIEALYREAAHGLRHRCRGRCRVNWDLGAERHEGHLRRRVRGRGPGEERVPDADEGKSWAQDGVPRRI